MRILASATVLVATMVLCGCQNSLSPTQETVLGGAAIGAGAGALIGAGTGNVVTGAAIGAAAGAVGGALISD